MRRGNSLGFKLALGCLLLNAPWGAMAEEATPQLLQVSLLASKSIDGTPSQQVLTDRNGVVLDAETTPALAYLRPGKNAGDQPLQLSLDAKANKILEQELWTGMERFHAHAAAGFIMDVNTGEIIALSSLESYRAHRPAEKSGNSTVNRVTQDVYEIGSSAKLMTLAMALETGKASMTSRIDGSVLRYGKFTIHDYWAMDRMLTIPEAVQYSSNIVAARLVQRIGTSGQKAFLDKMGQLDRLDMDGLDSVAPIVSKSWPGIYTLTAAFGHGIATSPLQAGMAVAALVNGGTLIRPTIFKRSGQTPDTMGQRVISSETSAQIRHLLRLNAEKGAARFANVAGYDVGGVTSTAEKVVDGRWVSDRVLTTFTAIYPASEPKYLLMTVLDEPLALAETHGFKTAPWNAAPIAAKVIERTAPILGVEYRQTAPAAPLPE
jgi:cell division protein FtsI (penicillin-binding protein 3)